MMILIRNTTVSWILTLIGMILYLCAIVIYMAITPNNINVYINNFIAGIVIANWYIWKRNFINRLNRWSY